MKGDDNVGGEMATRSNDCYSSLTKVNMNKIVQSSAGDVANEWREEHKCDNSVSDVIVFFKLRNFSAFLMFRIFIDGRYQMKLT